MTELARRAVACKGWRWMPGMRAIGKYPNPVRIHNFGENVQDLDDMEAADTFLRWQQPIIHGDHGYDGPYLPDLSDPATLGTMTALVREAWSDPEAHLALGAAGWVLMSGESRVADVVYPSPAGTTEAEALVAALEAAP